MASPIDFVMKPVLHYLAHCLGCGVDAFAEHELLRDVELIIPADKWSGQYDISVAMERRPPGSKNGSTLMTHPHIANIVAQIISTAMTYSGVVTKMNVVRVPELLNLKLGYDRLNNAIVPQYRQLDLANREMADYVLTMRNIAAEKGKDSEFDQAAVERAEKMLACDFDEAAAHSERAVGDAQCAQKDILAIVFKRV